MEHVESVLSGLHGGPFRRAEALAHGLTPGAVRHRLQSGSWMRLRPGVYVVATLLSSAPPWQRMWLEATAARLAVGPDAVVSHWSAAGLLRLDHLRRPAEPSPTVTVPLEGRRRGRFPGLVVHRAALPAAHVAVIRGLPATSPARTVVDLARDLPLLDGVVLADSALRLPTCTLGDLRTTYADCAGWPGSASARRAVELADPRAESVHESLVRFVLVTGGLPAPETQAWVNGDGWAYRVDFLFRAQRTIGEADGMTKYTSPDVLRAEKLREDRLREDGYEVVRVTWDQAWRTPRHTVRRFEAAFDRAARRKLTYLSS